MHTVVAMYNVVAMDNVAVMHTVVAVFDASTDPILLRYTAERWALLLC
jgi:hypothetical protein